MTPRVLHQLPRMAPGAVQKPPLVPLLGPHVPQLRLHVPQLGLQVLQLSLSGTPGEALEALKPRKIHVIYCVLRIAAGAVQSAPGGIQEQPK